MNVSFSRQTGGGNQQSVTQSAGTAMDEAFKKLSEGDGSLSEKKWGCFWIPDFPETELFFCFDQNKLQTLTLFHWKSKGRKLNEVQSITKPTAVQFKGGGSQLIGGTLRLLLGWTQRWPKETPFNPSAHCRISDNGQAQANYTLTCTNPKTTPPNSKPAFEKTISKSHIVEPKVSLQK